MKYKKVNKLPKDCLFVDSYPFPFKFAKGRLYVYEFGFYLGDSVWYRCSFDVTSSLGVYLSSLF